MIVGLRAVGKCEVEILGVLAKLKGKVNKSKWNLKYEVCDRCMSGRERKRDAPTYSGPNFV